MEDDNTLKDVINNIPMPDAPEIKPVVPAEPFVLSEAPVISADVVTLPVETVTAETAEAETAPVAESVPTEAAADEPAEPARSDRVYVYDIPDDSPWVRPAQTAPVSNAYSPSHYRGVPEAEPEKKAKSKPANSTVQALCLILACAVVSVVASLVTVSLANRRNAPASEASEPHPSKAPELRVVLGSEPGSAETSDALPASPSGNALSAPQIYELGCRQVVGINSSLTKNVFGQTSTQAVSGSGFVISRDGYIMTNYHVIEYSVQNNYDLSVYFFDGKEYKAEIIGFEKDNDVAVIKIEADDLSPVTFGRSDAVRVGEQVYAIGNPLGELTYTMTSGIVSALDREITTELYTTIDMFQIDAAVNSGNSGGPVYNGRGEVIGIVTAKTFATGVEGLGFAVPIDDALFISTEIIEHGYVTNKAYLGITTMNPSNSSAKYFGMPDGAYVYTVTEGSCAEKAGLIPGDIITAVDDYAVDSVDALKAALKNYAAGDTAKLTVFRNGTVLTLDVVFDESPASNFTK